MNLLWCQSVTGRIDGSRYRKKVQAVQLVVANWQWAAAAAVGLISLALGGWLQSRQAEPPESTPPAQEEPPSVNPLAEQVEALQAQLKSAAAQQLELQDSLQEQEKRAAAQQLEVQDAREESELLLLQLHQVQEELEHYFLLSQELQQQLEQTQSEPEELVPSEQLETMRSIKQRLLNLILERPDADAGDPAVRALLLRQQQALRRFAALHQQHHEPRPEAPSRPKLLSADDELVFL